MKNTVLLCIMDGYGLAPASNGNAVSLAKKPNLDALFAKYPHCVIEASGEAVGLPEGQMGNSEVGHMNLGAGRIVYQSLTRINKSIKDGSFNTNEAILNAIEHAKKNGKKVHILGLCSDGGVHSHTNHIKAIANVCKLHGIDKVYYHAFLDGRDVPPTSALTFIDKVLSDTNISISTVSGRYYGMDRDKNWNRIQKTFDAMTNLQGEVYSSAKEGIEASYKNGVTDEFMVPFIVDTKGQIEDGDSVIFANFRPDRAIQIATALSNPEACKTLLKTPTDPILDISHAPKNITFVSMMKYSDNVKGTLAFPLQSFNNLYGDVVAAAGLKQLRIAETEKYAHVTFFFDGGADRTIEGSDRILVNSPKVATYDLQPEMSAYEVCDKVVAAIKEEKYDTIILNFANCDMVGHTAVMPAVIKAVETVDECLGKIVDAVQKVNGILLVTADHGNDPTYKGTDHTREYTPIIFFSKSFKYRGELATRKSFACIGATISENFGIENTLGLGESYLDKLK